MHLKEYTEVEEELVQEMQEKVKVDRPRRRRPRRRRRVGRWGGCAPRE